MDEKQLKKNIKNLKSIFEYIITLTSDDKSVVVFEKFKRIVEMRKFKNVCIYDNLNNKSLVHSMINHAKENKTKISIINDNLSSPKIVESIEEYEKEKLVSFKNLKTMGLKSIKLFVFSATVFDEGSYFLSHKNLSKRLSKNNKALRVAIAHDFQIIPRIEIHESNEIADIIISENRVISVEKRENII